MKMGKKYCFFDTAPIPASVQSILGTICDDVPGSHNDTSIWLYARGAGQCSQTVLENNHDDYRLANKIAFVFQVDFLVHLSGV